MPLNAPVRPTMCATCPFRIGSPFQELAPALAKSALTDASRICHSTGSNAISANTGLPEQLCRGARDVQVHYMHLTGFIDKPTDEAWDKKCMEMGIVTPGEEV